MEVVLRVDMVLVRRKRMVGISVKTRTMEKMEKWIDSVCSWRRFG